MRLVIDGGKTQFDGVYATEKYSNLSVAKSKISPIMNDIPIIIDITKGGIVDRGGSLLWWMTQVNPSIFKQSSWWSLEEWVYERYKPYWDKFGELTSKFRQARLWELARSDSNFTDLLQLIWVDLISERYTLQREVCAELRNQLETRLMVNLGITYEELHPTTPAAEEMNTEVSAETLDKLSSILDGADTETGEVS